MQNSIVINLLRSAVGVVPGICQLRVQSMRFNASLAPHASSTDGKNVGKTTSPDHKKPCRTEDTPSDEHHMVEWPHYRSLKCLYWRKGAFSKATYLQILARMSPLPVAKRFPMGLGATEMTVARHQHLRSEYILRYVPEFLWP